MTYCLSLLCREGIVFLSDSRTSAGADNITVHPKMRVYHDDGRVVNWIESPVKLSRAAKGSRFYHTLLVNARR